MLCECRKRNNQGGNVVLQLQERLQSDSVLMHPFPDAPVRAALRDLSGRLERIKSWGGPFAQVDFSDTAKGLLES